MFRCLFYKCVALRWPIRDCTSREARSRTVGARKQDLNVLLQTRGRQSHQRERQSAHSSCIVESEKHDKTTAKSSRGFHETKMKSALCEVVSHYVNNAQSHFINPVSNKGRALITIQ